MKQSQAQQVIAALGKLGGTATLKVLYQTLDFSQWKTETPQANVRRIVQKEPSIYKVKPGLWTLDGDKEMKKSPNQPQEDHYYYQGLLLEIGNMRGYDTFAPDQDKNRPYLHTTLGEARSLEAIPNFTNADVVRRVSSVDVFWFNNRSMPECAFEVETSTDFVNSFSKYFALQDFKTKFFIVADSYRKKEFEKKLQFNEFQSIKDRIHFVSTDEVVDANTDLTKLKGSVLTDGF